MKKIFLLGIILSFSYAKSQMQANSIINNSNELIINDTISLKKGGFININLPAGNDFVFVKQKKSSFNTKLLGNVAGIVGSGAAVVGATSGNLNTLKNVTEVINKANAVKYGANAIEQVQALPISNEAKKIAGSRMTIIDWQFTDDGYIVNVKSDKKKYEINLQEALLTGEVKL